MSPKVFSHGFNALQSGFTPGAIHGSVFQLGGVAVIRPDNSLVYFYESHEAGDHPPVMGIVEALG